MQHNVSDSATKVVIVWEAQDHLFQSPHLTSPHTHIPSPYFATNDHPGIVIGYCYPKDNPVTRRVQVCWLYTL